ncbi:pentapeptide repeat-containing protein [Parvibaculaceae bacterium PLY_AMNH_Bact1]|nr:pentapeptide repeat-containing protein [Parvibaculaceae bacterium PLY_AMNH_Bact1]
MGLLAAIVELIDDLIADVTRIGRHVWQSPVPYLGFGFSAVIVTWLLLGRVPDSENDFLSVAFWSENPEGMRNLLWSLATVAAGAAGLYGLSLAARRTKALDEQARIAEDNRRIAEQNRRLSEQAQITDRFTKAVEQLGSENDAVRYGAVYALERIAKDSERDFDTVVSTLAAFVRHQAPLSTQTEVGASPPIDVVATLAVLARILRKDHPLRKSGGIDLRATNLRGLDLPRADLSGFSLERSNLEDARLWYVDLSDARLSFAKLNSARLWRAKLNETWLFGTELRYVDLEDADMTGAACAGMKIDGADFRNVEGMSQHQFSTARYGSAAPPLNVPEGITLPEPTEDSD